MVVPSKRIPIILIVIIFLVVLFFALTFAIHQVTQGNSLGYDYAFYWAAGHSLLHNGLNPYSREVSDITYYMTHGQPMKPGERPFPFPYPLYVLWLPLPLFYLNYDWSQAAWMALNLLIVVSVVPLLFPRAPKWIGLTLPLFYAIWFTLILGNYALLIGILQFVILAVLLYSPKKPMWVDASLGVALAWSTGKPQMVWLFVLLALFISLKRKRLGILYGFAGGLFVMALLPMLVVTDWPLQWLRSMLAFPEFIPGHRSEVMVLLFRFFPHATALILMGVLGLVLVLVTAYIFRQWWFGRVDDLLFVGWCAIMQNLFDISGMTPDAIILLVPILLWVIMQQGKPVAKRVWFAGILIWNLLFVISQTRLIPDAVDHLPLGFYGAWLAYYWVRSTRLSQERQLQRDSRRNCLS